MIIDSKFKPSWWLRNPHLQTLFASKLRQRQPLRLHTERLELPDGDFVDLALANLARPQVVCMFHGLAGSINSAYANGMLARLLEAGFGVAFMHFRGCSGVPNRLPQTYHSGHTDDIRFFIQHIRARIPATSSLHAVAYSLGANAMLKYLGEEREACPLASAIAVSPPLVLEIGANRIRQGFSRVYQRYLLQGMRAQHRQRIQDYPEHNLPPDTDAWKDLWDFDAALTAPLNGFEDVHDYYHRSSSRQYLTHIGIPTHVIHALDDPFFTEEVIPTNDELSSSVTFELSRQGGHVAFVAGTNPLHPVYWLEPRMLELLRSVSGS